jgi:hypothetical protein
MDKKFIINGREVAYYYLTNEQMVDLLEKEKNEMESLMKTSTLPDEIDINMVNDLLLNIRKEQIKREL